MAHEVKMPQLGMTQDNATIVSWKKAQGDSVSSGDVLMEVETDKAVMEVEAQHDGVLTRILVDAGDSADVGSVIALIGADASDGADAPAPAAATTATPEAAADSGADSPAPAAPDNSPAPPRAPASGVILASPKARRLARERGIELQQLRDMGIAEPILAASVPEQAPAASGATPGAALAQPFEISALATAWQLPQQFAQTENPAQLQAQLLAVYAKAACGDMLPVTHIQVDSVASGEQCFQVSGRRLHEDCASSASMSPDLLIHDLSDHDLHSLSLPAQPTPQLVLTRQDGRLCARLITDSQILSPVQAHRCLQAFVRRLENPLFHLV